MIDLKTAKENLASFVRDGKKHKPELTDDWIFTTSYYYSGGTKVFISSEKLDKKYFLGEAGDFLSNYIFNNKIELDNNKLKGFYAVTKNGLIDEQEYFESEDLIENNKNISAIKPSKYEEGTIYMTDEGEYCIYLGHLDEEFIIYSSNEEKFKYRSIENIQKKKYILYIDKKRYTEKNDIPINISQYKLKVRSSKHKMVEVINDIDEILLSILKTNALRIISDLQVLFLKKNKKTILSKEIEIINSLHKEHIIIKYKNSYYFYTGGYVYRRNGDFINLMDENDYFFTSKKYFKIKNINDFINLKDNSVDISNSYVFSTTEKVKMEQIYIS